MTRLSKDLMAEIEKQYPGCHPAVVTNRSAIKDICKYYLGGRKAKDRPDSIIAIREKSGLTIALYDGSFDNLYQLWRKGDKPYGVSPAGHTNQPS